MILFTYFWLSGTLLIAIVAYHYLFNKNKYGRSGFVCLLSIILTGWSICFLNEADTLTDKGDSLIKRVIGRDTTQGDSAKAFFLDNFIFINNAYARELLPLANPAMGKNAVEAVTDRRSVYNFFNWCREHRTDIDLIVCDIGFEVSDTSVRQLIPIFRQMANDKKLIISDNEHQGSFARLLPNEATGDVTEESYNERFNFQKLIRDTNVSLAYRVYTRMDNIKPPHQFAGLAIEHSKLRRNPLRLNIFLPSLYVNAELTHLSDKRDPLQQKYPGLTVSSSANYYNLNAIDDTETINSLSALLKQRKAKGLRNVLFLGAFEGQEDLHNTIFGQFHGPAIILNIIYNLHIGANVIGPGLFGILFIGYATLFYLLILVYLIGADKKEHKRISHLWGWEKWIYHYIWRHCLSKSERQVVLWRGALEFVMEVLFLLFLSGIIYLTYRYCGVILNIAGLTAMFVIFYTFFNFFHKLSKIKT